MEQQMLEHPTTGDRIFWVGVGVYAPIQKGQPYQHVEWYSVESEEDASAKGLGTADYFCMKPW